MSKVEPSPPKSERRKRRKKEKGVDFSKIPGIKKMTFSRRVQKLLGAIVGENVTGEDPWIMVNKETILDDIELKEGSSEFLPIKPEMEKFKPPKVLIGYVPNEEEHELDEFFVCVTKAATNEVMDIIEKAKKEHEQRMQSAVAKFGKQWRNLGSDREIAEVKVKNNRALYEVEIESRYPIIMKSPVKFHLRLVSDVRDGYVEMLKGRSSFDVIPMRRTSMSVQAAPICNVTNVQTNYVIPVNQWSQYQYGFQMGNISDLISTNFRLFAEMYSDRILEMCYVTGNMNLYKKDYELLVEDEKQQESRQRQSKMHQFMSFADVQLCKNKILCSVSWHPTMTGIVACSYTDTIMAKMKRGNPGDDTKKLTYNKNPVLIWSYVDQLKPKLILEAHREVTCIAYCPFNDEVIVGGCRNGQIIIWDLKDKLKNVETQELLTPQQCRYRILMFSFMTWMKNIKNPSFVQITAISDLSYSHQSSVTGISWMPPFYYLDKLGHLKLQQTEEHSQVFMTTSLDGTVKFWDLNHKFVPVQKPGEEKRKPWLRRGARKKPSFLMATTSVYKELHRLMRPIYELFVEHRKSLRPTPLTTLSMSHYNFKYHCIEQEINVKNKHHIIKRVHYEFVNKYDGQKMHQQFCVGTNEGEVKMMKWEGFRYEFGKSINVPQERATVLNTAKYHDGPVVSIDRWPLDTSLILTVGGKTFCIWHESFEGKPILWRRSRERYTHASWNAADPSYFETLRNDGNMEVWCLNIKSNKPIRVDAISGQMLTGIYVQHLKTGTFAISDHTGTLRIYKQFDERQPDIYHAKTRVIIGWYMKQKTVLGNFYAWQERWKVRHAESLLALQEEEEQRKQDLLKQAEEKKQREEQERERLEKERARLEAAKLKPPPGMYKEWAANKVKEYELKRMNLVLLHNKQLDPKTLREQQIPIKKLQKEEAVKEANMIAKHNNAEKIFNEAVAMYFPHVLKREPPPPKNPYAKHKNPVAKEHVIDEYAEIVPYAEDIIKHNPFIYHFDWLSVVKSNKDRRSSHYEKNEHRERYWRQQLDKSMKEEMNQATKQEVQKVQIVHEELEEEEEVGEENEH